ncbi:MAG: hypothetical protein M3P04_06315, partial [Actinomycetota bacterium]|nr:hypothetical protein [Actinomycetota bacterium]
AALTYRIVETPVRESRTLALSRPLTFALAAALLVTSVGGAKALLREPVDKVVAVGTGQATAVAVQTASEARKDLGTSSRCFVDFAATKADKACHFGDKNGARVVVLMGDSHAAHWFPAMQAIAEREHWQLWFWAKPACAFADVRQYTKTYNREYTECQKWRADVMRHIADLPRVDAVVIGRSYSYPSTLMDSQGKRPGGAGAATLWEEGAAASFAGLQRSTKDIVMIREVPRPGGDVPGCLSKHPGKPAACSFPRAGHIGLDKQLFAQEQTVLPPGGGVHYIDMTRAICPADPCSVMSPGGAVVFRDLHHLTARFSRELSGVLEKAIRPYVV